MTHNEASWAKLDAFSLTFSDDVTKLLMRLLPNRTTTHAKPPPTLDFTPENHDRCLSLRGLMDNGKQVKNDNYAADIASIREARVRIAPYIHETPVLTSKSLDSIASKRLYFKCECFQKGGAFKIRGASNAIFSLSDDQAAKGVLTHNSGNHAAAVALAAKLRGIPAYVVIPKNAPKCKVENVRRYGGQIFWSESTIQSRESITEKVQQETGAILVHPFNNRFTISGQGTISLELLEQVPEIDTIVVPISGGGLISGVTLAAKAINPSIQILAAEPRGADDAAQSKAAGQIVILPETKTIADGLRAFLGDLTWPVVRDLVDEIIVVDDAEIIKAMRMCYEILKIAVEPSGAIGLAAVLSTSFAKVLLQKTATKLVLFFLVEMLISVYFGNLFLND
ncbi:hypothetical protein ZIOFF_064221 [Zingiber officinale]|uniref:Serine racemase n=1 Tax=Zingiber officinale TaxID=94328 RepID=A0A8J5CFI9_ZINOF|nr:hypothetical protein ZIOFF_064221 [Zingiber officinale]